jgi:alanine racemase
VHDERQIDWLAAHKSKAPHKVFLKLNSGMNRLGFAPAAYRAAWLRLDALPQVAEITLMTHLANADAGDGADLERSLAAFAAATAELRGRARSATAPRPCASAAASRPRPTTGCGPASSSTARHPTIRCTGPPTGASRRR